MKNLFEIVQENPQNFDEKEVKHYIDEFIKVYDNTKTLKEKIDLRVELDTQYTGLYSLFEKYVGTPYHKPVSCKDMPKELKVLLRGIRMIVDKSIDYLKQECKPIGFFQYDFWGSHIGKIKWAQRDHLRAYIELGGPQTEETIDLMNRSEGTFKHGWLFTLDPRFRKATYQESSRRLNGAAAMLVKMRDIIQHIPPTYNL